MGVTVEAVMAAAVPVVGVIVWLIRLEGRINLQDARYEEIKDSLVYIRDRLDRALNGIDTHR
jgi:hypothetical protein